jgi:hypothetical protein
VEQLEETKGGEKEEKNGRDWVILKYITSVPTGHNETHSKLLNYAG